VVISPPTCPFAPNSSYDEDMHPARIRNILWMLKRNGYKTEVTSNTDADGTERHMIAAVDSEGQRWSVTGSDVEAVVAELLKQLGTRKS
jgi:hypothetical protein